MNYAGCIRCGSIVPLMCAGSFPMHMPMPMQMSPMGAYCGYCGARWQVFTCTICGTQQMPWMPGMPAPSMGWGAPQYVAPVVQAAPGASQYTLRGDFHDAVVAMGKSSGGALGEGIVDLLMETFVH